MAKFVNYKKRNVTLPAGCKDLIDLLEPGKRRKATELLGPHPNMKVMRDDSFISKLSEIGKPISAALESGAPMAMLSVSSLDEQTSLDVHRMGGENLSTSVSFTQTALSEQKMKAIFENLGLRVPQDSAIPEHFIKGQPVQLIYEIDPERVQAGDLAALAAVIFREFCSMEPTSQVRVHFLEFTYAT